MAQLTFTIADGILKVSGGGRTEQFQSTDYKAKTWSNSDHEGVIVFPVDGDHNPYASGTWTCKDHAEFALSIGGVTLNPTSAERFVMLFNQAVGTSIGFNTQYPQHIITGHIALDTSIPEQLTTHVKAGFLTITAPSANTGVVYIGDSNVDNTSYPLEPDRSVYMELVNLSLIYAMNGTPGDHVSILGAYKD